MGAEGLVVPSRMRWAWDPAAPERFTVVERQGRRIPSRLRWAL